MLVLFALFSFVLVGALALALDVGFLLSERRAVQSAADSAALAAARGAMDGASLATITSTAIAYAETNAGDDLSVSLATPPNSGVYQGRDGYFQVTVTKDVQKFFLGAIYAGAWGVQADAVAMIGMDGFGTGILALNPDQGGIQTAGSSRMHVDGGSIVSNFNINTSGDTRLTSTEWVVANKGFQTAGSTVIQGGKGENPNGPIVPDPLAELLSPPTLPAFPSNPVPTVNPGAQSCYTKPGWWPPPQASDYIGLPGRYSGGARCVEISGDPGSANTTYVFPSGNYRFQGGAGIALPFERVRFDGGVYNFAGGPGIHVEGMTHHFEMRAGMYSFTGGATINIGGNAPQNILGAGAVNATDSYFYFSGGGIVAGGSNRVVLYPGTYIFDGGPGIRMSGDSRLEFMPGTYAFWFGGGADWSFEGSSRITLNGTPYVKAYFCGTQANPSDLQLSGSSSFNVPSGEYYFDRGSMINSGSSTIVGNGVFLYFKNGGRVFSSGSAAFAFTALTTQIYPGFYPGVYMYSDRANTATFQWFGTTSTVSTGIVYLPRSPLVMGGASNGKMWRGQLIADRFQLSGYNVTEIEFIDYVPMQTPVVALVQ